MSMGLQCLIMTRCLQGGNSTPTIIANILAISSFHFSTLEEYYCGGLYLGVGNGVTDGSVGIIGLFIYLGMFGNDWTTNTAFGVWTYADLFVYGILIANATIIILCFKGIFVHSYKQKTIKEGEMNGETFTTSAFLLQVFGYFFSMGVIVGCIYQGEEGKRIIDNPVDKQTQHDLIFDVLLLACILMSHLTICIQVNHVSAYEYSPWANRLNLFLIAAYACVYCVASYNPKDAVATWSSAVHSLIIIALIAQWHFVLNVIAEMSDALGVRVFCVKDKVSLFISLCLIHIFCTLELLSSSILINI